MKDDLLAGLIATLCMGDATKVFFCNRFLIRDISFELANYLVKKKLLWFHHSYCYTALLHAGLSDW